MNKDDFRLILPLLIEAAPVVATLVKRALAGALPSENDKNWYDHFPGLEDLAFDLRSGMDMKLRAQVQSMLKEIGSPEDRIKLALRRMRAS